MLGTIIHPKFMFSPRSGITNILWYVHLPVLAIHTCMAICITMIWHSMKNRVETMKKKYTFTLDPKIIAEIEKLDAPKSSTVERALRQFLNGNDQQPSNESVPVPSVDAANLYAKKKFINMLEKTICLMEDILKKQSILESNIEDRMKYLDIKLRTDVNAEISGMHKEFSKILDRIHYENRYPNRKSGPPGKIP